MGAIKQPATSIKLTNVSVVRLKKQGIRFEVACYNNKVVEYRSGVEKDIDNVLQLAQVFSNVSKGTVAPKKDLIKAFGTDKINDIIQEILMKGELQVGEKERAHQQANLLKDIIEIVTKKTINPESNTPYTATMVFKEYLNEQIEKVLNDLHFNPNTSKNAKQQALEAISLIRSSKTVPIERVKMKIRVVCDEVIFENLKIDEKELVERNEDGFILLIDPEKYRVITTALGKNGKVYIIE